MEHAPHPTRTPSREATHDHDAERFRRRFWLSLALTVAVLVLSPTIWEWFGARMPAIPYAAELQFLLATVLFLAGGSVFLVGSLAELRRWQPGMMTLVSLAITVAFAYSVAVTFGFPGEPLYWELATLITVMLLGHWLEMEAVGRARGALRELARLLPDTAERIIDDRTETVPVAALAVGDRILIRPGGRIPADGVVEAGESSVDEAAITGESRPVEKSPGAEVVGGSVNGEGALRVRVTRVGAESALGQMMRLVEQAQTSRSRTQALADRAASLLTLVALAVGSATAAVWWRLAPPEFAVERSVAVFVIACPHALGLAIPLVVSISTALAARHGLLVRDRLALELARDLDFVLFDKTGTLTRAEHRVIGMATLSGVDPDAALATAAAVETASEHLLARALVASARERGLPLPPATGFVALPGRGVRAVVEGEEVAVGGPRLLESLGVVPPPVLAEFAAQADAAGESVIYLVARGAVRAAFSLRDTVRPESREAVAALQQLGIEVIMVTGDSEAVARRVARELGIRDWRAGMLHAEKAQCVEALRRRGFRVAMVGDGINDAPALAAADVGIAIGAGTAVAVQAGGIILVRNDPRDVVRIVRLSRATYRKMVQNLGWAVGYNVIALPLAAGVLAPLGIWLAPAVAALLMSGSTIVVALNAQLLRRLDLAVPPRVGEEAARG